jgi:hypothetical protein
VILLKIDRSDRLSRNHDGLAISLGKDTPVRYLAAISFIAVLFGSVSVADELPRAIKPVVVWTGTDSSVTKQSFSRCISVKQLGRTWDEHWGKKRLWRPPEVDFDSHMLIAIFNGDGGQDAGISVTKVVEEKNLIKVRYRVLYYQVGFTADDELPDLRTRSFAFAVLPASGKEIIFDEDVNNTIGSDPVWKKVGQIPAIEKK